MAQALIDTADHAAGHQGAATDGAVAVRQGTACANLMADDHRTDLIVSAFVVQSSLCGQGIQIDVDCAAVADFAVEVTRVGEVKSQLQLRADDSGKASERPIASLAGKAAGKEVIPDNNRAVARVFQHIIQAGRAIDYSIHLSE